MGGVGGFAIGRATEPTYCHGPNTTPTGIRPGRDRESDPDEQPAAGRFEHCPSALRLTPLAGLAVLTANWGPNVLGRLTHRTRTNDPRRSADPTNAAGENRSEGGARPNRSDSRGAGGGAKQKLSLPALTSTVAWARVSQPYSPPACGISTSGVWSWRFSGWRGSGAWSRIS